MTSHTPRSLRADPIVPALPPGNDDGTILVTLAALSSAAFPSTTDATDVYLAYIMRTLDVRSAFVAHLDTLGLHVLNAVDNDGCGIPRDGLLSLETTFCQYVRATGTPMIVTDAATDPRVISVATRTTFTIGSYIGVPLTFQDGRIYGTLCALDPQPRAFTQAHLAVVQIIARQLAHMLEYDHQRRAIARLHAPLATTFAPTDERMLLLEMVAHDIRNPLSGLQGYIELIQADVLGPVSVDQHQALEHMRRAVQFINRLTIDLLDAAAADAGTLSIMTEVFDPRFLAQSVLATCQAQARAQGLALRFHSDANVPDMLGDAARLEQILLNFMSNALRYTTYGTITLQVLVQGQTVQFRVEDTGPGISEAAQATIWKLHARNSLEGNGLGLGLYIVQRLAHAMEGSVGMQSELEHGSTFWVQLPIRGPAAKHISLIADAPE